MIYKITKDLDILKQKSNLALPEDCDIIPDLINTCKAHQDRCVGLAAIQVEIPLRIIIVKMFDRFVPMVNPVILKKYGMKYTAEESCLSLEGTRKVKRYEAIDITYSAPDNYDKRVVTHFSGLIAQIIQHECDHLDGVLI